MRYKTRGALELEHEGLYKVILVPLYKATSAII